MTPVLIAEQVSYAVAGRTVLDDVSIRAEGGRVVGVRGPSGSGKSSLLAILGGLVAPTDGTVTLDAEPVTTGGGVALRRRFGLVLQSYGLVSALTAHENIAVTLQAARRPRAETRSRVAAALTEVGLGESGGHLVEELSGGQQQRVALARALAGDADVFLADEPTAELDVDNRAMAVGLLVARARAGAAVVLASHDPEVLDACDDVLDLAGTAADPGVSRGRHAAPD